MSNLLVLAQNAIESALFDQVVDALSMNGYAVLPAALPIVISDALLLNLTHLDESNFHSAAIGRGKDTQVSTNVRSDHISWIDPLSIGPVLWLQWAERLRLHLNRHLYLGLFSFESHFARYHPGDFYLKHRDAFKGRSNRVVTVLTYLNSNWQVKQGGELIIYPDDNKPSIATILPLMGTVVIFLSDRFPHEVLPATHNRVSVAGWFRLNE